MESTEELWSQALSLAIKSARKDLGLTQDEAAAESASRGFAITAQTIGSWERNEKEPKIFKLMAYVVGLGYTMAEFFERHAAESKALLARERALGSPPTVDQLRLEIEDRMRVDPEFRQAVEGAKTGQAARNRDDASNG